MSTKSSPAIFGFLRKTYRTRPEQIVGLAIFSIVSFSFFLFQNWVVSSSLEGNWYEQLVQAPWMFKNWPASSFWLIYQSLLPLSIWMIWRCFSFHTLKLEISLFLAQLIFQGLWVLSFFVFHETLLSLAALLFSLSTTLLCALLLRKREPFAGILLIPAFIWIFYVVGINMAICIFNP